MKYVCMKIDFILAAEEKNCIVPAIQHGSHTNPLYSQQVNIVLVISASS